MDKLLGVINVMACGALAAATAGAILSPRVRDGVVIKVGLIAVVLGFAGLGYALAVQAAIEIVERALALLHVGLLVAMAGWWLRSRRAPQPRRRKSDWMDLEDLQRGGGA